MKLSICTFSTFSCVLVFAALPQSRLAGAEAGGPQPSVTVSHFYSQERTGDRESTVGVGLSTPVPLWNRNTGNGKAAEARQEQAEVAVYLARRRIERELRERVAAYDAPLEQMSRWRPEIVESLRESAELADPHYRLGAVPVATYVELQEKYLEALEAIDFGWFV